MLTVADINKVLERLPPCESLVWDWSRTSQWSRWRNSASSASANRSQFFHWTDGEQQFFDLLLVTNNSSPARKEDVVSVLVGPCSPWDSPTVAKQQRSAVTCSSVDPGPGAEVHRD